MIAALATWGSGTPILAILAILSVLSVALIIVKAVELFRVFAGQERRVEALERWADGEEKGAISLMASGTSPADRVTHFAMKSIHESVPRAALDAELTRRGDSEVEKMSRSIRLLELVAMIAPLLGLLGTVLGMIQSFQELELAQGAANASLLAGGIWQALLTTAAGLIVAIPAAIGATLLSARVDRAAHLIEASVGEFFLLEDIGTLS